MENLDFATLAQLIAFNLEGWTREKPKNGDVRDCFANICAKKNPVCPHSLSAGAASAVVGRAFFPTQHTFGFPPEQFEFDAVVPAQVRAGFGVASIRSRRSVGFFEKVLG